MASNKYYRFKGLLQNEGWLAEAWVGFDEKGVISEILKEKPKIGLIDYVDGWAIPGFQNAHSHAFQYAMAGLAEIHSTTQTPDDFWSWRQAMYHIALQISPAQMEAIATMLYAEMVRHGYTHVAEFHYVHHSENGKEYNNVAEMGERLISAAKTAGINITLVPMFYQKGGFGTAPTQGQRRFISSNAESYNKLLDATEAVAKNYAHAQVGFGFHSLRAVDKMSMEEALAFTKNKPIHLHIAEQLKEIEDCKAFYGKRPVEWLYENFDVNDQWHLVHATHLSTTEVKSVALSGADVVLCPTTEGNLGDGIFKLREYIGLNGRWSIGTDSHIGIDPKEELRLLDYGQRLTSHKRNTFYSKNNGDAGLYGFNESLITGRSAMGSNTSKAYFTVGQPLNALVLNAQYPLLASSSLKSIMSTYIYSGDAMANLGTIINGNWVVKNNIHQNQNAINQGFKTALSTLNFR